MICWDEVSNILIKMLPATCVWFNKWLVEAPFMKLLVSNQFKKNIYFNLEEERQNEKSKMYINFVQYLLLALGDLEITLTNSKAKNIMCFN